MTDTPFIDVADLTKQVTTGEQTLTILQQIRFAVMAGQTVAITGESGSGKTTLLSVLAGLDRADHGSIRIDDHELMRMDEEQRAALRGRLMGFVFQNFLLVPGLTALENVMLPAELQHRREAAMQARMLLEQVGLADRLTHYPSQLSGGEQQRVAIARAFVTQPRLLFADEPTGNLDSETGKRIIELLFELNRSKGTTLMMVTHDVALARRCQRQLLMHAGRLTEPDND